MSRQPEKPPAGVGKADEAFLSRWSRLKVDEGVNKAAVAAERETARPEEIAEGGQLTEEEIVAALPDIESLEEVSDFTPFLREGVPELLKRQALRRLWRVNPVFAEIDGLAEYAEDYTEAASVLAEVKTAYKVGRGYIDRDDEDEPPAETPTETAAGEDLDAAGEAVPKGDVAPQSACGPQAAEIPESQAAESTTAAPESAAPRTDVALAEPEARQVGEPMQTNESLPTARIKGRAAARRWGLPEQ